MSRLAMSPAILPGLTEPPYRTRTSSAASPEISRTTPRTNAHISPASSALAVWPVPIAQMGSYATTKSFMTSGGTPARLLRSWDCRVVAATAVEEVLTTVIDQDITPQLIIADYHLAQDYKGLSAIEAINAEIAVPAPAIMISSDNSASLVEALEKLGIPLLTKPVDPARLRAMMHHLLLQERD